MRKIQITAILIITILTNICVGCEKKEKPTEIYFFEDKGYYHHEGSNEKITFFVKYAYTNRKPTIELLEVEGKGIEDVTYEIGDISEEEYTNNLYNGYHIGTFYIEVDVSRLNVGECIEIKAINIKCNGKEKEIIPEDAIIFIKNDFAEDCYRLPLQPLQVANGMATSDMKYPVTYCFEVYEEFTLTDFSTSAFVDIRNISIDVNGKNRGDSNEIFPLKLKKGDVLNLQVAFSVDNSKENANICTDIIISGLDSKSQLKKRYFSMFFSGLSSKEDANNLTKEILNK